MKARAFVASNCEIAVLPSDAGMFLDSCNADGIEVLGWDLWIANHIWDTFVRSDAMVALIGGKGDAAEAAQQLEALNLEAEIQPAWLPHVRVNFTLGD